MRRKLTKADRVLRKLKSEEKKVGVERIPHPSGNGYIIRKII